MAVGVQGCLWCIEPHVLGKDQYYCELEWGDVVDVPEEVWFCNGVAYEALFFLRGEVLSFNPRQDSGEG